MGTVILQLSPDELSRLIRSELENYFSKQKIESNTNQNEKMSVIEVAAYLKKSKNTIYYLTHKKQIPFHRPGKDLLFYKHEIDSWQRAS